MDGDIFDITLRGRANFCKRWKMSWGRNSTGVRLFAGFGFQSRTAAKDRLVFPQFVIGLCRWQ